MRGNRSWLLPLTGVGFIVLAVIGFAVGGEPPDANDPVQDIVNHYADDKDRIQAGAMFLMAATLLLIYFGSYLRKVLQRAPGEKGLLSDVVFAGTVVFAVGAAIDSTISFALAESATDIDPTGVQALQALWDNDFMPLALGIEMITLSAGLSIILHRSLPAWLGWTALALGVIGLTPIGFFAFLGTALWILVVSVMLALRERHRVIEMPDARDDSDADIETVAMPVQGRAPEAEHRHGLGRLHRGKVDH